MAKSLFIFLFFFFSFGLTTQEGVQESVTSQVSQHHVTLMSHDGCGKTVHRPCSSCTSSIEKSNRNSIKFFLSTWTWRVIKSSQAKLLQHGMMVLTKFWLSMTKIYLIALFTQKFK